MVIDDYKNRLITRLVFYQTLTVLILLIFILYPVFYFWEMLLYVDLEPDSIQQALRSTKSIS